MVTLNRDRDRGFGDGIAVTIVTANVNAIGNGGRRIPIIDRNKVDDSKSGVYLDPEVRCRYKK